MREDILSYICCSRCQSTNLKINTTIRDEREIRQGEVICLECDTVFPIENGIVNLMPDPSPTIQDEQQGWIELLGETSDSLVDTMLQLPHYYEDALWIEVAQNFDGMLSQVDLKGKRVLDIGAGRCWSTRHLVLAGTRYALGLDILTERFIGLETADIYFQHDNIYFDRMIGDMNNLPIRPKTFDIVFMTATLHHSSDITRATSQFAKVLNPGGVLIIINEPVRSLFKSKSLAGCIEIDHGINENVYRIFEYLKAVRSAGLNPHLIFPHSIAEQFRNNKALVKQSMGRLGYWVVSTLWHFQWGQQLVSGPLLPFFYLIASMPLALVAQKSTNVNTPFEHTAA